MLGAFMTLGGAVMLAVGPIHRGGHTMSENTLLQAVVELLTAGLYRYCSRLPRPLSVPSISFVTRSALRSVLCVAVGVARVCMVAIAAIEPPASRCGIGPET